MFNLKFMFMESDYFYRIKFFGAYPDYESEDLSNIFMRVHLADKLDKFEVYHVWHEIDFEHEVILYKSANEKFKLHDAFINMLKSGMKHE